MFTNLIKHHTLFAFTRSNERTVRDQSDIGSYQLSIYKKLFQTNICTETFLNIAYVIRLSQKRLIPKMQILFQFKTEVVLVRRIEMIHNLIQTANECECL